MNNLLLSELISTRISHDLIGNIGAVANAVELMEDEDADFMSDIKDILKVSSQVLVSRLKFFRMAFGLDNANLEDMALVEKTTRDYLQSIGNKNFPIILKFDSCSQKFSRIMMLSVMILADLIVKGGEISVCEKERKLFVNVSAISKISASKTEDILALLAGTKEEYLAQYAPAFFLKDLLGSSGLKLFLPDGDVLGFIIG